MWCSYLLDAIYHILAIISYHQTSHEIAKGLSAVVELLHLVTARRVTAPANCAQRGATAFMAGRQ